MSDKELWVRQVHLPIGYVSIDCLHIVDSPKQYIINVHEDELVQAQELIDNLDIDVRIEDIAYDIHNNAIDMRSLHFATNEDRVLFVAKSIEIRKGESNEE